MKKILTSILFILCACFAWAGGESEASSADNADYIASLGRIVPASEINISSYIAQLDYDYEIPSTDLGITILTDTEYLTEEESSILFQIGIQGSKIEFDDLPGFNLCFLVDTSGSMAGVNKMKLIKKAIIQAAAKLRSTDRMALMTSDPVNKLLIDSVKLSASAKQKISVAADGIKARGDQSADSALEAAYRICEDNYIPGGINRVVFFSDGNVPKEKLKDLAEEYKKKSINLTTVGVGQDFNSGFMTELARAGGGSSRFISNDELVKKHFSDEIDRMLVPAATDLDMKFKLNLPAEDIETWGYGNEISGNDISYSLATLHNGDYETILVTAKLTTPRKQGTTAAASFSISYTSLNGIRKTPPPFTVTLVNNQGYDDAPRLIDPRVLQSRLMLDFARNLIAISEIYDDANEQQAIQNTLYFSKVGNVRQPELPGEAHESGERQQLMQLLYQEMLDLTLKTMVMVGKAETRLGKPLFVREKGILFNYITIICNYLRYPAADQEKFNSAAFLREDFMAEDISDAVKKMIQPLLSGLPKGSSVLYPGVIVTGDNPYADLNSLVKSEARKAGCSVTDILSGTNEEDYRENVAAVMAGRAADTAYVLLLILSDDDMGKTLYVRVINVQTGKVLKTDSRGVY